MDTTFCLFISWQTFGLLPFWAVCIMLFWICCTSVWVDMFSVLLGMYQETEFLGHMVTPCLTFFEACHFFSKGLCCFTLLQAMYQGCNLSKYSPTLLIFCLSYFSLLSRCKVLYCGFGLCFPNDLRHWASSVCFMDTVYLESNAYSNTLLTFKVHSLSFHC